MYMYMYIHVYVYVYVYVYLYNMYMYMVTTNKRRLNMYICIHLIEAPVIGFSVVLPRSLWL